jgi:hypothetical protein
MATPEPPDVQPAVVEAQDLYFNLPLGKPLNELEVSELLRANITPIVLLAGAANCGKTTLLASLHDSFQWKSFGGFLAAGSQTLVGFEERCFDSRAASEADNPDTLRTQVEDGQLFYHLKLRKEELNTPIQHLLIADMSGEYYDRALDSGAETRELTIIRRADHFVHLIDGSSLASDEFRTHSHSNAMMLMRRCFEEQMLEPDARIDVLLTKWDIVLTRCGETKSQEILQLYERTFTDRFLAKVARLRVLPIAARPHYRSSLQPAYGLSELLQSWVDDPPRKLAPRIKTWFLPRLSRQFDAFAMREAPHMFSEVSS